MNELPYRSPCGDAPVYHVTETDTTMKDAQDLVAGGAPSGVVIVTDYQRAGRGRLAERRWLSPRGASLMFTVALSHVPNPGSFPLRCGLAVALAVESLYGLNPRIKWPNDLLVNDRKLCGVLCEHVPPWTFGGVGVNLNQQQFDDEIGDTATSLRLLGATRIDRDELLRTILASLCDRDDEWRDALRDRLWRRGESVHVSQRNGTVLHGTLTDIDRDGCLILHREDARTRVVSGELLV